MPSESGSSCGTPDARNSASAEVASRSRAGRPETGDHFYVACTMDNTDRAATELKTYVEALVAAGFRVEPDIDQVLRVWGAGVGQAG